MSQSERIGLLIAMTSATVACVLQIIGLIRYVNRMPDDVVGISLYAASIAALALVALVSAIRWLRERNA